MDSLVALLSAGVQLVARRENARVEALRRCENARAVVGSDKGRTRESEHQAR